jgi:hypothetical protein
MVEIQDRMAHPLARSDAYIVVGSKTWEMRDDMLVLNEAVATSGHISSMSYA